MHKFYCLILSCFLLACNNEQAVKHTAKIDATQDSISVSNLIANAKSGDFALRMGNDISSNMVAQFNLKDKRFSHIGLCFKEDNVMFVYHSIGSENGTHQFIQKTTLNQFYNLENNLAFGLASTNFSQQEVNSLQLHVHKLFEEKIPFDIHFNWTTDDSLYCSEFVGKVITKNLPNRTIGLSHNQGQEYIAVDNILNTDFVDSILYFKKQTGHY